jgi:hypothetical protein
MATLVLIMASRERVARTWCTAENRQTKEPGSSTHRILVSELFGTRVPGGN